MFEIMKDVAAFHRACDVPVISEAQLPSNERQELRMKLIREEVNEELLPAMQEGLIVEIADAITDSIYVLVGAALEYGIPLDKCWEAVHRANMAKVDPETGRVRKRADGKVLKPNGWTPPDIELVLAEYRQQA